MPSSVIVERHRLVRRGQRPPPIRDGFDRVGVVRVAVLVVVVAEVEPRVQAARFSGD
jgi:hypothetical protein